MRPTLALLMGAALLLHQDDAEIRDQVARISGKDPRVAFDAISKLADIAASKREAVEKAAASMPDALAFYRDALREELRVLAALGARCPKVSPLTIDWKETALPEAIADLNRASGSPAAWIELAQDNRKTITASLVDATLMQGLETLVRNVDLHGLIPGAAIKVWPGLSNGADYQSYRNFLVDLWSIRLARSVEFGGPARQEFTIGFMLYWEPGVEVVRVQPSERVEILDDQDRPIKVLPAEPAKPDVVSNGAVSACGHHAFFRLAIPEHDVTGISRLRGAIRIAHPMAEETINLAKALEKGARAAGELAEVELTKESFEGKPVGIRVRPKVPMARFAEMPIQFRVKLKDGSEWRHSSDGTRAGEEVAYGMILYGRGAPRVPLVSDIESLSLVLYRETFERKVFFEFRDIRLR